MAAVYLEQEFFSDERFGLAAEMLGEHRFTTEMRVVRCWKACFDNLTASLTVRQIRVNSKWAGDIAELLRVFVEVGIVDDKGDGTYFFHGADVRVGMLLKEIEGGRAGGLASGKARRARARSAAEGLTPPQASLNPPSTPPSGVVNPPSSVPELTVCLTDCLKEDVYPPDSAGGDTVPLSAQPKPAKPKKPRPPIEHHQDDYAIAQAWAEYAREVSTTVKVDLDVWANAARLLRTLNGQSHEDLRALLAFVRQDSFWRKQCASLPAMRTKMPNGNQKWENARGAMDTRGASSSTAADAARKAEVDRRLAAIFAEEGANAPV